MSYVSAANSTSSMAKTVTLLNPDFFRRAALAYDKNTDRKEWLEKQIINLQAALMNYAAEMQGLMDQGAKLDGKSSAAQWLQTIGGTAILIPTPYTQIGGAIVSIAGIIVGAAEKKKDSKALQALTGTARELQSDAGQIKTYYENYTSELQKLKVMPLILFGSAVYLILKK